MRDRSPLHALGLKMLAACSPAELCDLAAAALAGMLPGRGVHVQIWSRSAPDGVWEASAGPEMSAELARGPLLGLAGPVGEIVVDSRDESGRALDQREHSWIAAVTEMVTQAATRELAHEELERNCRELSLCLARLAAEEEPLERLLSQRTAHVRSTLEGLNDRALARIAGPSRNRS